jgi:hypothetical protein
MTRRLLVWRQVGWVATGKRPPEDGRTRPCGKRGNQSKQRQVLQARQCGKLQRKSRGKHAIIESMSEYLIQLMYNCDSTVCFT